MASLQRALLVPELNLLSSTSWLSILEKVLFPLLTSLLETPNTDDMLCKDNLEETRLRATSILCKTFLHYLTKLLQVPSFNELWIKIVKFIELYMKADNSELLAEAATESLKNMLVVMHANGVFHPTNSNEPNNGLWEISWNIIDQFCPKLKGDFMTIVALSLAQVSTVNTTDTKQTITIENTQ